MIEIVSPEQSEVSWFDSGTPAQPQPVGDGTDLRPVQSETRQPLRKRGDRDEAPPTPEPGDDKLAQVFRDGAGTIARSKAVRKTSNEEISATISDLEAQGIPREVTKLVIRISEWDIEKRGCFDRAYVAVRAYAEIPLQTDMFRDA